MNKLILILLLAVCAQADAQNKPRYMTRAFVPDTCFDNACLLADANRRLIESTEDSIFTSRNPSREEIDAFETRRLLQSQVRELRALREALGR
jgi:hypothetical protein